MEIVRKLEMVREMRRVMEMVMEMVRGGYGVR